MSGTNFPTDDNWLLCHGCNLYFSESEIDCEDQSHQWCAECHREWVARQAAYDGAEGWER